LLLILVIIRISAHHQLSIALFVLFNKVQNVEVSDTSGDAMKYCSRYL